MTAPKPLDEQPIHDEFHEAAKGLSEIIKAHSAYGTDPIVIARHMRMARFAKKHGLGDEQPLDAERAWQPIDTLDRTKMDFVLVAGDGAVRLVLWNPAGHWEGQPCQGKLFAAIDLDIEATHWMPLPAPPAADTLGATGGA